MATQKGNKPSQKSDGMGWSNPVRSSVDVGRNLPDKDESHVSLVVILCLAIMALTFVITIPILAIAYADMYNATQAAIYEIKKMRDLRAKILLGE